MNFLKTLLKTALTLIVKSAISIVGSILILWGFLILQDFLGIGLTDFRKTSIFVSTTIPPLSAFLFPWIFPVLLKRYTKIKAGLIWTGIFSFLLLISFVGLCIESPRSEILFNFEIIGVSIFSVIAFTSIASLITGAAPQRQ